MRADLVRALGRQDPELAAEISKWNVKIRNIIRAIHKTTGAAVEDIEQDILECLWEKKLEYVTLQVRYEKRLWDVLGEEDGEYLLKRSGEEPVMLRIACDKVETVSKVSLSTWLYQALMQFCADRFARHFTEKRGFRKDTSRPPRQVQTIDRLNKKIVTKEVPHYIRCGERLAKPISVDQEDGLTEIDLAAADDPSPEQDVISKSILADVEGSVSPQAFSLLRFLMGRDENYSAEAQAEIDADISDGVAPTPKPLNLASAAEYFKVPRSSFKPLMGELFEAVGCAE